MNTLHMLDIPDEPDQLAGWLDRQLVSPHLLETVAELRALHAPPANQRTLDHVLGDRLPTVVRQGLAGVPRDRLTELLDNSHLLLDLQERVLNEGGRHWDQVSSNVAEVAAAAERSSSTLTGWIREDSRRNSAVEESVPARRTGSRGQFVGWLVAAAALAVLAALLPELMRRPADGGDAWGWSRPDAIPSAGSPAQYFTALAAGAAEWDDVRPVNRTTLARRLEQFRQGCTAVILTEHPLPAADRQWLVGQCRAWRNELDRHLNDLEAGDDPILVRGRVDATARRLTDSLTRRAAKPPDVDTATEATDRNAPPGETGEPTTRRANPPDNPAELAAAAVQILKTHCTACHASSEWGTKEQFDVLDREHLLAAAAGREPLVTPGDPGQSKLWTKVREGAMPPAGRDPRPTPDEIDLLEHWILAGAPFPEDAPRQYLADATVLARIESHLRGLPQESQGRQRYFTFTHLYNNPRVTSADLRLYRAALVKLVNSLSWRPEPVRLTRVDQDQEGVILSLNLDEVGWPEQAWSELVHGYPYGIRWQDPAVGEIAERIGALMGADYDAVPMFRGDWFVAAASRPPAYYRMLELPETVDELTKLLDVDLDQDFQENQLRRAAFADSGVSRNNRAIDRHDGRHGYFYLSHDFDRSTGRKLLFRFPLGPRRGDDRYADFAFEPDGGELIFRLPNGLQAYFLVDDSGRRLDVAPIRIVHDINAHSGSIEIVAGISCIGCHRQGLMEYRDSIGQAFRLSPGPAAKVRGLYAGAEELAGVLHTDRDSFRQALNDLLADDLAPSPLYATPADYPAEPVSALARRYQTALGPDEARLELGLGPNEPMNWNLMTTQELGLSVLAHQGVVPRSLWEESDAAGVSVFQRVAQAYSIGTPVTPPLLVGDDAEPPPSAEPPENGP